MERRPANASRKPWWDGRWGSAVQLSICSEAVTRLLWEQKIAGSIPARSTSRRVSQWSDYSVRIREDVGSNPTLPTNLKTTHGAIDYWKVTKLSISEAVGSNPPGATKASGQWWHGSFVKIYSAFDSCRGSNVNQSLSILGSTPLARGLRPVHIPCRC
jgi:hypothetical protein